MESIFERLQRRSNFLSLNRITPLSNFAVKRLKDLPFLSHLAIKNPSKRQEWKIKIPQFLNGQYE